MSTAAEPGMDIATVVAPAADEKRGGDLYVIERVGDGVAIAVADVMGKGAEAAPYADHLRTLFEARIGEFDDPAALLEQINHDVWSTRALDDRYATACAMYFEPERRAATWAFAGHLPPHWLDTGMPLDGANPGMPLGLQERCGATSAHRRPLRRGEGVALFTDGLEDVLGPGGDRFGTARITHTLSTTLHAASCEEVAEGLKTAACAFGDGDLYDDICIVAVRMP